MVGQMACRFVAGVAGYGKAKRQARCLPADGIGRKVKKTTGNVSSNALMTDWG